MMGEDSMTVMIHCLLLLSFTSLKWDTADELCPESYRVNSPNEIRLLAIADNFQRQYSHLYPDRKLLLLCPVNECGVKVTLTVQLILRDVFLLRPSLFCFCTSERQMPPCPLIFKQLMCYIYV